MKNKLLAFWILTVLGLSGCSGGGGGGSSAPSTGGGDNSTPSNPSTPSTPTPYGKASFYGFSTDSATAILDKSETAFATADVIGISNEFGMNIRDASLRKMDVAIYQPNCTEGLLENKYAAVLLHGSDTAQSMVQLVQTASGLKVQKRAMSSTTANDGMGNTTFPFKIADEGAVSTFSGSCDEGVQDLGVNGKAMANAKIILFRDGSGNLYVGVHESKLTASSSNMGNKVYLKYGNNSYLSSASDTAVMPFNSTSAFIDDVFSGTPLDYKSTADAPSLSQVVAVNHTVAFKSSDGVGGTQDFFYGVNASNLSGKALYIGILPTTKNHSMADLNPSGVGLQLLGAKKLSVYIEQ